MGDINIQLKNRNFSINLENIKAAQKEDLNKQGNNDSKLLFDAIFAKYDTNNTGILTTDELELMKQDIKDVSRNKTITEREANKILKRFGFEKDKDKKALDILQTAFTELEESSKGIKSNKVFNRRAGDGITTKDGVKVVGHWKDENGEIGGKSVFLKDNESNVSLTNYDKNGNIVSQENFKDEPPVNTTTEVNSPVTVEKKEEVVKDEVIDKKAKRKEQLETFNKYIHDLSKNVEKVLTNGKDITIEKNSTLYEIAASMLDKNARPAEVNIQLAKIVALNPTIKDINNIPIGTKIFLPE